MKIEILADADAVSDRAAQLFQAWRPQRAEPLLVFPTGSTPIGLYRRLVAARQRDGFGFGDARFVTLDEYVGPSRDDRRCLGHWLTDMLLAPMGVPADRLVAFDPQAADLEAEAARIEAMVAGAGGIDLLVLGLGSNGHLGFNEPGSPFGGPSHVVELTEESIRTNAGHWGSEAAVPRRAITLGLGTFERAREIVLIVTGAHKASILAQGLEGPVGPDVPASWLQGRANVTVIADEGAASQLERRQG